MPVIRAEQVEPAVFVHVCDGHCFCPGTFDLDPVFDAVSAAFVAVIDVEKVIFPCAEGEDDVEEAVVVQVPDVELA